MTQNTRDTWTVEQVSYMPDTYDVYADFGAMVCESATEDNARLIAAAPDLLEFARKKACGLPACTNGCAREERQRDTACEAHALVAKAEGRT